MDETQALTVSSFNNSSLYQILKNYQKANFIKKC